MKTKRCLVLLLMCALRVSSQQHGDVIVSEILFNPAKDGYDYVELFNKSDQFIPLSSLLIANRNAAQDVASVKKITNDTFTLRPGAYCVITSNAKWLKLNYTVKDTNVVIDVSSLPSFPDDEGSVVLLRKTDSAVIDEVDYNEKWHFQLLSDKQGVALERIDVNFPSQDENNWTSASYNAGYGTPGYENSQRRINPFGGGKVSVLPKVFSPDNDGSNDVALIEILSSESSKVANAVIYDVTGKPVRYLIKNELLGSYNRFKWDGYDDRLRQLPVGIYILFTQIFDMNGKTIKYRNCIVLDRRKI